MEPDFKIILAALIGALSTAEHSGEVEEAVKKAAQLAGFLPKDYASDEGELYQIIEDETKPPSLWLMK